MRIPEKMIGWWNWKTNEIISNPVHQHMQTMAQYYLDMDSGQPDWAKKAKEKNKKASMLFSQASTQAGKDGWVRIHAKKSYDPVRTIELPTYSKSMDRPIKKFLKEFVKQFQDRKVEIFIPGQGPIVGMASEFISAKSIVDLKESDSVTFNESYRIHNG